MRRSICTRRLFSVLETTVNSGSRLPTVMLSLRRRRRVSLHWMNHLYCTKPYIITSFESSVVAALCRLT